MTSEISFSLYSCQCARYSRGSTPGRGYHYSHGADVPTRSILFLKYQNISYDNKQRWLHVHCSSCKDKAVKTFLCKHLMYLSWLRGVCACVCVYEHAHMLGNTYCFTSAQWNLNTQRNAPLRLFTISNERGQAPVPQGLESSFSYFLY